MKKLCIFVEGQTEQIFMKKLVIEVAGHKKVDVELRIARGGKNSERKIQILESITPEKAFYVQIIDSGNDSRVQSDIRENAENLEREGFIKIIGLRDVYPEKITDLPDMIDAIRFTKPSGVKVPIKVVLALMEVETWFLKEHTHLAKINSLLVVEYIKEKLGYDLIADDLENDSKYNCAADVLDEIYKLVGRSYDKKKSKVNAIVENLDYEIIYLSLIKELKSLNLLIKELDDFF